MLKLIEQAYAIYAINVVPTIEPTAPGAFTIKNIVTAVANWVLYLGGAIAFIYLIYGGILYITAGGDAEKASKGKTALINAIIGIIIIFLALVIIRWVTGGSIFRP